MCPLLRLTAASPISPHHQLPYKHHLSQLLSTSKFVPCIEAYCSLPSYSSPSVSLHTPLFQLLTKFTYVPCVEAYCSLHSFSSPSVSLHTPLSSCSQHSSMCPVLRLIVPSYFPYRFHYSRVSNFLSIFWRNISQFAVLALLFPNFLPMLFRHFTQRTAHIQAVFKFHH